MKIAFAFLTGFLAGAMLVVGATVGLQTSFRDATPYEFLLPELKALHRELGIVIETLENAPTHKLRRRVRRIFLQCRSSAIQTVPVADAPVGSGAPAINTSDPVGPMETSAPVALTPSGNESGQDGLPSSVLPPQTQEPATLKTPLPADALPQIKPAVLPQKSLLAAAKSDSKRKQPGAKALALTPEQAYRAALQAYRDGRFAQAREQFTAFTRLHSGHGLTVNALYWIGETWYAEGSDTQALSTFAQVVTRYPRHAKSADALLKMAYLSLRQGEDKSARTYLLRLENEYPESSAARLGRQTLEKMRQSTQSTEMIRHG